jgi:4-diphosphocytidyl-2-C-methyl-D-erythritol kinase
MIVFPNGKINLGLNILSKRTDGFHNLETLFYPLALHDALEIIPAADGIFEFISSGLPIPGETGSNLCSKAFRLMQSAYGLPAVKIHLHKVIPTGAGLGGGSSDGAFTLKLLNDLFETGLEKDRLKTYAITLGSDCAFFLDNQPSFARERGDHLEPVHLNLSGLTLALIIPPVHVSTAEAFAMVTPVQPVRSLKEVLQLPVEQWKDVLVNDFEKPVFVKYPVIGEIKQKLYSKGALFAAMTGSGAAVYGIFNEIHEINESFPGNFITILPL